MYELLTLETESRPYLIVEYPSRVVFTFKRADKELAELTLHRLNFPETICCLEDDDVCQAA